MNKFRVSGYEFRVKRRRLFSAAAEQQSAGGCGENKRTGGFGDACERGKRQAVGNRERIEGFDVGWRHGHVGAAVALAEIGGEGAEIRAVDEGSKEEIPLVPVGKTLAEVGGEDAEVGAVDRAVEVGVAE